MSILATIITFILTVITLYMCGCVITIVWLALAGKYKYRRRLVLEYQDQKSIAIFIPAYKEEKVIENTIHNIIQQGYNNSHIWVIAQHFDPDKLEKLRNISDKVTILEFNVDNSSKTKAIQYALDHIKSNGLHYDIALVLDADNHLKECYFLNIINDIHSGGEVAVQAHRIAKNTDTDYSKFDAIAEEMNNTIFRRGQRALGLSAITIGSGMSFDYDIFSRIHSTMKSYSGWDRELEFKFLEEGYSFEYLENIHVLDEKVNDGDNFQNQRTRWIFAQLKDIPKIPKGLRLLLETHEVNYFFRAIQAIIPPRLLLIGGQFLLTVLSLIFSVLFIPNLLLLVALIFSMFIAIPKHLRDKEIIKLIAKKLPGVFFRMFKSLLNVNKAKGKFIHTEHGT